MTGRYPVRTGVTDWIAGRPSHEKGPITTPRTATELKLAETTIAERLKPAGYRSASIGKWHLGGEGFWPTDQGFDVNIGGNHSGSPPRSPKPYFGPFELPNLTAAPGRVPDRETHAVRPPEFIEQNSAESVSALPAALHGAHPACARAMPTSHDTKQKAQGRYNPIYAAMVESLDESVGQVLAAIDRAGVADRTMVMFFSDNGGLRYEGKATAAGDRQRPACAPARATFTKAVSASH